MVAGIVDDRRCAVVAFAWNALHLKHFVDQLSVILRSVRMRCVLKDRLTETGGFR